MASVQRAWEEACKQDDPHVRESVSQSFMHEELLTLAFALAKATAFEAAPQELRTLAQGFFLVGHSGVDEDAFQRLRTLESRGQGNSKVSLERLWFTLVQQKVLSKLHQYPEVRLEDCSWARALEVARGKPLSGLSSLLKAQPPLPLKEIVSDKSPDPRWTTFSPQSQHIQYCDVALWQHCVAHPHQWRLFGRAWLSQLATPGPRGSICFS
eukprot:9170242-Lingulodinium_polyedra.AAC.1